jgi:hypothetical protein
MHAISIWHKFGDLDRLILGLITAIAEKLGLLL